MYNDNILFQQKHIVVGSGYYNPIGICKSLNQSGLHVILLDFTGSKVQSKAMRKYSSEYYSCSSVEECVYLIISKFKNEKFKPFIYTGHDIVFETINKYYNELVDNFYFFNCGSAGESEMAMRKYYQCTLAKKVGLTIPPTEQIKRGEIPKALKYPVITKVAKSTLGANKQDSYICNNSDELKKAWSKIKAEEIIAQEYIRKKNEIVVLGISVNDGRDVETPLGLTYDRLSEKSYGFYMHATPPTYVCY